MENHGYKILVGKFAGKNLGELDLVALDRYLGFLEDLDRKSGPMKVLESIIRDYLRDPDVERELEKELEARCS